MFVRVQTPTHKSFKTGNLQELILEISEKHIEDIFIELSGRALNREIDPNFKN